MTLTFVHQYYDHMLKSMEQEIDTYDNVVYAEYEDQADLQNGRWLHVYLDDNTNFSISIDGYDYFYFGKPWKHQN